MPTAADRGYTQLQRLAEVFHVVLYQPEIPPNTGNIIRLCANTGSRLHLVEPMGFSLDDKQLQRAGLDYHEYTDIEIHRSLADCLNQLDGATVYACSTRGRVNHATPHYREGDVLLFGPETRGLPVELLAQFPPDHIIRLPMVAGSRSLNLANAVAVIVYEAWRQLGFSGGK